MNRRALLAFGIGALLAAVVITSGSWIAGAVAQDATPETAGSTTMVFVERNVNMTDILRDTAAPSAGDLRVWGPNALYDETDSTDTGATTQGTCVALNAAFDCLAHETIVLADGSTLEIQGIQLGGGAPSTRTIVGGSGQYLGAIGTVTVAPTEDLALWTKTIVIDLPGD